MDRESYAEIFLVLVWSLPLLALAVFQLALILSATCSLMVQIKAAQLRAKKTESRKQGGGGESKKLK